MVEKFKCINIILLILFICSINDASAQRKKMYNVTYRVYENDTIAVVSMEPVTIIGYKTRVRFYRNLTKLKKAIMVAYPIARDAEEQLYYMREHIKVLKNEKEIKKYVKKTEKKLIEKYTPILKKMTFYQGMILLKLIDRQTGDSGYTLLKELKNGFTAFFWQTIGSIYGANLKQKYDPNNLDEPMEDLVLLYEKDFHIEPFEPTLQFKIVNSE